MPDFDDFKRLVQVARTEVEEIDPDDMRRRVAEGAVLVDVRDESELRRNPPLARAVHLSRGQLEYTITDAVDDKDTSIVLYCAAGMRSVLAARTLQSLGYRHVAVLRDGLQALRLAAGQPWYPLYPPATDTGEADDLDAGDDEQTAS
ncbi:rhodanese-like domain-containing protein [Novosphingobium sp.]|uniref:rhodanese-like domain-containing protein n=1 Tax=Novosphingobium sp. TaxID=1874826 RepID=UPI0038B7275A